MGLILRYLDSSVVLDLVDPSAPRHASVDQALLTFDPAEFGISDLVRMECQVGAIRSNDRRRLADLAAFTSSVVVLPMTSEVFDRAAMLRATHLSLRTPDALHLAAALEHGCGECWTNDLDLAKRNVGLTFRTF